jgi:hypothetical protein
MLLIVKAISVPLPAGWTASLTNYGVDTAHAPSLWWGEVTFLGPEGASFVVKGSVPAGSIPGDVTDINTLAQVVIAYVWPVYEGYVLNTIAHLSDPNATPPPVNPAPVSVGIP